MATTRQYYNQLRITRNQVCQLMGVDPMSLPSDRRLTSNATLAVVAVLIKALTDNNVLTDAQLSAAQATALAELWAFEPPQDPVQTG